MKRDPKALPDPLPVSSRQRRGPSISSSGACWGGAPGVREIGRFQPRDAGILTPEDRERMPNPSHELLGSANRGRNANEGRIEVLIDH